MAGRCPAPRGSSMPPRPTALLIISLAFALLAGANIPAQVPGAPPVAVTEEAPHFFHLKNGAVRARWILNSALKEQTFAKGEPIILPAFKHLIGDKLEIKPHTPSKATWAMPERVLAISDVEGEYTRLRAFLRNHGVIDKSDRWSYGKGHVVCVGDFVDRGLQVTETLLLLHRLDREADAAGGQLHFVIGNHEAMMMGGDVRYTDAKYKTVAGRFGIPTRGLLGADTEIGRWLRQRNAIIRIGDLVFVHAGLAPELVSPLFDHDGVNRIIRSGLGKPTTELDTATLELLWGRRGPLWYRGYFPGFALEFGPTPTTAQLGTQLERMGGSVVVVGHTKVQEVTYVDRSRYVLAIDTTWIHDAIVRGVLFEGAKITVLDLTGELKRVQLAQPGGRVNK